jgi:hypothetical protein
VYGNPIASRDRISEHSNQLLTPAGVLSNVIRNAALHTGTPWGRVNRAVNIAIEQIHTWIGVDSSDPRTTAVGPFPWISFRTGEDLVGNFFHAGLILAVFAGILYKVRKFDRVTVIYLLATTLTFVLFSVMFKWQLFGARYHLPFFILFMPLVALALTRWLPDRLAITCGVALALAAIPWLFSIDSRPLIPTNRSITGSILTASREDLYFANGPHLVKPYTDMTTMIKEAGCSTVGLMLSGYEAEYPLWVQLGAPRSSLRLEWLVTDPNANIPKPVFHPCAVICEGCEGRETVREMPLVYQNGLFRLYAEPAK